MLDHTRALRTNAAMLRRAFVSEKFAGPHEDLLFFACKVGNIKVGVFSLVVSLSPGVE